tara:strand:+ start:1222 stop:1593 length:372 start_codon:yes stop_codon:yes gene_type:complete
MRPLAMTFALLQIQSKIKTVCKTNFTSVLLNLHREGKDSNGLHSDNEQELGVNHVITSVFLGEERYFQLKHKTLKIESVKFKLGNGSLLIMEGLTQNHWLHKISKTSKVINPRINLIFRKTYN